MARQRVTIVSRAGRRGLPDALVSALDAESDLAFLQRTGPLQRTDALEHLPGTTVLATTNLTFPELDDSLLTALPELRHIVLYATGYDHVDLDLLERHRVGLSVLPEYATNAVAEHALAMGLSLTSRVHLAHDRSRGLVPPETSLRGVELTERTSGVLGVGRIGLRIATMLRLLGTEVIGTDIDPSAVTRAMAAGIDMVSAPDLLRQSDVLFIAASMSRGAPAILDESALDLLPDEAFVVNVGRPGLVDTTAVARRLRAERLRGYAVDDVVLDPAADADLLDQGRVLQTGHCAWWKDDVLSRGGRMFGRAVLAAVRGRPIDVVGPDRREAAAG